VVVWYIEEIVPYEGTITLDTPSVEVTVIELTNIGKYYMVTGYLDLSDMLSVNEIDMKEYIDLGEGTYKKYLTYKYRGEQLDPIIMLTPKYFTPNDNYKLTLTLVSGTSLQIPYKILLFKYNYREV